MRIPEVSCYADVFFFSNRFNGRRPSVFVSRRPRVICVFFHFSLRDERENNNRRSWPSGKLGGEGEVYEFDIYPSAAVRTVLWACVCVCGGEGTLYEFIGDQCRVIVIT